MTFRTLVIGCLLLGSPAFADAGTPLDGGDDTPDASAGNGGSEHMTQEGDEDMKGGPCSLSRDCERGFSCVAGMCRYVGYRQATQGCSAGPPLVLIAAAALALLKSKNRR